MNGLIQILFLLITIGFVLTAPQPSSTYQRFVAIPAGENGTILTDLEAEPQLELLKSIQRRSDVNRYLLFTRKNPTSPQKLYINDESSILSSNFNPSVPTAVLIHGWQSQPWLGLGPLVRKALLDKEDVNVILLDWRIISSLDYNTAVVGVPFVGKNLGEFLEYIKLVTGAPFTFMHLIGHSLGAHVAANAGKSLNGQLARITGLDPAGPLWNLNPKRLKSTDAIYTEAIHTNGGGLGIESPVADVDFYPNGGSLQPNCLLPVCHHARSYELFAASITHPNHLIGKKCANLVQMEFNLCRGNELPLGNDNLQKNGSGIYRLNTGRHYPY